jgi:cyclopropane fatty-acyl-phospholipid synthase-like methyltransferase
MTQAASIDWWQNSLNELGVQGMEKLLSKDATWEQVVQSGRDDLAQGLRYSRMTLGKDRTVVDVGCGLGRVSHALAEHFGRVVGLDVAASLLEQGREHAAGKPILFELADGERIQPKSVAVADTVFSYEVLYIVPPETLKTYFSDIFALLRSGGEFVFQLNVQPLRWRTRMSYLLRNVLFAFGIKQFRGWPTGAGFRRYPYTEAWVREHLTQAGFQVTRVAGPNPRQMWFVATKPVS